MNGNGNGNGFAAKVVIAFVGLLGGATLSAIGHDVVFSGRIAALEANRIADKEQLDRIERSTTLIWQELRKK